MIGRKYFIWIVVAMLVFLLILNACAPGASPTLTATPATRAFDLDQFIEVLQAAGAQVQEVDRVEQPFFGVAGQALEVDGQRVQVFEYPDQSARQDESEQIGPRGMQIGETMVQWTDQPNFWSRGRIVVLFLGENQATIELLSNVLGDPITQQTDRRGTLPPQAAVEAEIALSQKLGLARDQITILDWVPVNWPDACLGLAGPDELCAQVITPGWEVTLEAQGQRIVAHTDRTGEQVRFEN